MNREDGPVEDVLEEIGFEFIDEDTTLKVIEAALQDLAAEAQGASDLRREMFREAAVRHLVKAKVKAPARMVNAALGTKIKQDRVKTTNRD